MLFRIVRKNIVVPYNTEEHGCSVKYLQSCSVKKTCCASVFYGTTMFFRTIFLTEQHRFPYTEQLGRSVQYGTTWLFRARVGGGFRRDPMMN